MTKRDRNKHVGHHQQIQRRIGLATAHEHKVADEYARVYAEKGG